MMTKNWFIPLALLFAMVAMIAAVACASDPLEVTKIVEVPVTQIVPRDVEVTKIVVFVVAVTKIALCG